MRLLNEDGKKNKTTKVSHIAAGSKCVALAKLNVHCTPLKSQLFVPMKPIPCYITHISHVELP